jgi:hypothetical protein
MHSVVLTGSKTRKNQTTISLVPEVYISIGCGREKNIIEDKNINEDRNFCFVFMDCFTEKFWICRICFSNVDWK